MLNENASTDNLMHVTQRRIINTLKSYQEQINANSDEEISMDNVDIINIFNDFLSVRNSNNIMEDIAKQVGECNINQCVSWQRIIHERNANILDKIHCFFSHSFYLTYDDETEISQMINTSRFQRRTNLKYNEPECKDKNEIGTYHCGYSFKYGYKNESVSTNYITVLPKYNSLKEEILRNPFYRLSQEQFNKEIDNTCLYGLTLQERMDLEQGQ